MNFLFITKNFYPSSIPDSKRFSGFSESLSKAGHKITIITETPNAKSPHDNVNIITVKKFGVDSEGMFERLLNHLKFMLSAIKKGSTLSEIDVVIATSPPLFNLIAGSRISKRLSAKFVVDIRDIWPEVFEQTNVMKPTSLVYKFFGFVALNAYKKADLIAVVTPGKKKLLSYKYPQFESKIKLLSNGFNLSILDNDIDLNIKKNFVDSFNVVYSGKIGLAQNLDNFIELAINKKENANIKFHIFGSGNGEEALIKKIEEKGLSNVKFYGYRKESEIATALQFSQIAYVSLGNDKLIDSIPTKIFEALVFGCPILLSAKGDAVDLVNEFSFGLSSLPDDQIKLQSNFDELIKNNDKFKQRRKVVQTDVIKKYSRDVVSLDYEKYLFELFDKE